ncbi:transcription factor bHLH94 [Lolium perenne]|uniref:transcription factor bHLH94 n=1 Tax=Lolium perenne TaxID=4522 RepID=UPI0021EA6307|nr:transcription factor bHLH94-like [Lolium perenne]
MALEAVVFPRQHLACGTDEVAAAMSMHAPSLGRGVDDIDEFEEKGGVVLQEEAASATMYIAGSTAWAAAVEEHWDEKRFYPPVPPPASSGRAKAVSSSSAAAVRKRRRRPKAVKNREETESQRRNHIAVERNRRRQMNDYLSVLRSAMPPSYAQRGDQASIVAGAINFVKELEQLLQSLEAEKRRRSPLPSAPPFTGLFTSPQYSAGIGADSGDSENGRGVRRGLADVEVAVAESHANVKVLAPRRPRQLLRMAVAMQCLGLTVLHLSATATADHLVFYSFSLKMEDECRLTSVDDIAAAVHQMVLDTVEDQLAS